MTWSVAPSQLWQPDNVVTTFQRNVYHFQCEKQITKLQWIVNRSNQFIFLTRSNPFILTQQNSSNVTCTNESVIVKYIFQSIKTDHHVRADSKQSEPLTTST